MSIRPLGGETTSAHMHRPMVATIMSGPRGQEERRGTKRKTDRRSNKKTTRAPVGVHTHRTVHTIHTTSALTRSPHLEGSASSRRPRGATRGQGYRYSTEVPCRYYFLDRGRGRAGVGSGARAGNSSPEASAQISALGQAVPFFGRRPARARARREFCESGTGSGSVLSCTLTVESDTQVTTSKVPWKVPTSRELAVNTRTQTRVDRGVNLHV